jgi:hypothetical protein
LFQAIVRDGGFSSPDILSLKLANYAFLTAMDVRSVAGQWRPSNVSVTSLESSSILTLR